MYVLGRLSAFLGLCAQGHKQVHVAAPCHLYSRGCIRKMAAPDLNALLEQANGMMAQSATFLEELAVPAEQNTAPANPSLPDPPWKKPKTGLKATSKARPLVHTPEQKPSADVQAV